MPSLPVVSSGGASCKAKKDGAQGGPKGKSVEPKDPRGQQQAQGEHGGDEQTLVGCSLSSVTHCVK
jgi:hypothetical protein